MHNSKTNGKHSFYQNITGKNLELPDNAPEKAVKDGPGASSPAAYVRDLDRVPGSWLQTAAVLPTVVICRMTQQTDLVCCCVCVCVFSLSQNPCNSAFQITLKTNN